MQSGECSAGISEQRNESADWFGDVIDLPLHAIEFIAVGILILRVQFARISSSRGQWCTMLASAVRPQALPREFTYCVRCFLNHAWQFWQFSYSVASGRPGETTTTAAHSDTLRRPYEDRRDYRKERIDLLFNLYNCKLHCWEFLWVAPFEYIQNLELFGERDILTYLNLNVCSQIN